MEEKERNENEDIFVQDIQSVVLTLIEALAAIRKLDRYLRSNNDNQELHSLTKIQQRVLNKAVTKTKLNKYRFLQRNKYCSLVVYR